MHTPAPLRENQEEAGALVGLPYFKYTFFPPRT